jgi:hypothetical protein
MVVVTSTAYLLCSLVRGVGMDRPTVTVRLSGSSSVGVGPGIGSLSANGEPPQEELPPLLVVRTLLVVGQVVVAQHHSGPLSFLLQSYFHATAPRRDC